MIKAILAADANWGIGKDGIMPWPHNSEDLKWFKECTDGECIIMGRKTWESLPFKPLPNRYNIVVTSKGEMVGPHATVDVSTLHMILDNRSSSPWIIGGGQLVASTLQYIDEIYISRIDGVYDCDAFLPHEAILKLFKPACLYDSEYNHESLHIEKWTRK